jgi:hypothetical protein
MRSCCLIFSIQVGTFGKGTRIVAMASGDGLLALSVENASPAECPLVEAVLAGCFLYELP